MLQILKKTKIIKIKPFNQKGVSLPISLFVLMGILLASAALIRTGEFSVVMSGDLAHRSLVANSNDTAVSTANDWLVSNRSTLINSNASAGYLSASPANIIDYTVDANWATAKVLPADTYGNVSSYFIYRLCTQPNTAYNGTNSGIVNSCALKQANANANSGNSVGFNSFQFTGIPQLYYKIVVRTVGPKKTNTVTETVVGLTI